MLEDLFKVVRSRLDSDNTKSNDTSPAKSKIPDNLLFKCPRCQNVMFMDDYKAGLKVCSACSYHSRISARERLEITADKDSFVEYDPDLISGNPLEFDGYPEKLAEARAATGLKDAVLTGECSIRTRKCVIVVMDSRFMMASMGSVVGEKITRAFERATEKRLPVVVFAASGGARMQEGILSLMQMAKTSGAVKRHSDAGNLYITVLTDPTTGGVTASFAMEGDIILAEPDCLVAFAGPRVIEQTIRQKLPKDFQTSEFVLQKGFIDSVVSRNNLKSTLVKLLKLHGYSGEEA